MTLIKAHRRARSRWAVLIAIVAVLSLVIAPVALAALSGSTFEGGDGNLIQETASTNNTDWCNRTATQLGTGACPTANETTGLNKFTDKASGSGDDSLGQGAKENGSCPTVVSGSIPPNKSDLTRFYVASESGSNNHFFLYVAWERTNILGNANMDFEFNKGSTPCSTAAANKILVQRTDGDMLITFDFVNGGGKPVIGVKRWVGTSAAGSWSAGQTLGDNAAEAAVNAGTVSDPINPAAPRSLSELTFGEAAIDLTDAGIVAEGECAPFTSAYLKSRSAASFTSELKDFIAPHSTSLSNCGSFKITKTSAKAGDTNAMNATFSVTGPGGYSESVSTVNGEVCLSNLQTGTYHVTETAAPSNYAIDDTSTHDVVVANTSTCSNLSTAFTDTPMSEIQVKFKSLAGTGVTAAQFVCDDGTNTVDAVSENGEDDATTPVFDDTDETFTGLLPGTYTCTIVVDP